MVLQFFFCIVQRNRINLLFMLSYRPKGNNQLGLNALLHLIISFVCLLLSAVTCSLRTPTVRENSMRKESKKMISFPFLPIWEESYYRVKFATFHCGIGKLYMNTYLEGNGYFSCYFQGFFDLEELQCCRTP